MTEESKTRDSSSGASQAPTRPEDEFLDILSNRGKHDSVSGAARDRGFTVVAAGTPSLQFLQTLCYGDDQSYNNCLTARYRLGVAPVVGTLFDSFISDIVTLARFPWSDAAFRELRGDLLPAPGPDPLQTPWRRLLPAMEAVGNALSAADGRPDILTRDLVRTVLGVLAEVLGPGDRLVLFCELPEHRLLVPGPVGAPQLDAPSAGFVTEWLAAGPIFETLPERVGVVVGFADPNFADVVPIERAPHRRRLSFSGATPPFERVQRFKPAALAGDYAATRDAFGLEREAIAIAGLILHPQTDPMTISIEAPWGQGKSSFLNFVGRALTVIAAGRVEPGLGESLKVARDAGTALDRERVALARAKDGESEDERRAREKRSREVEEKWLSAQEREAELWTRLERAARGEVLQVRFNAWRHQDARYIWAGLLSEVSKAVEAALPRWRRWVAPLFYAFRERTSEVIVGVVLPTILAVAIAATLVFFGVRADPQDLAADVPFFLKLLVPGSAVVVVMAWRMYRVIQPVSQRVLDYVRLPDYRDQLGFQEQVLRDLGFLRKLLRRRRPTPPGSRRRMDRFDRRIVVFIDDLDRCPDHKVMEVLQTVNLVLVQGAAADATSASLGAFVLLAVDTEKIHQAIEHHYAKQGASTGDPDFAQSYLRKIIQLQYFLPEPPHTSRLSLIEDLFTPAGRASAEDDTAEATGGSEAGGGENAAAAGFRIADYAVFPPRVQVFTEVEDTPAELDTFHRLGDFLPDNPREMKRLLNVHRFVKILVLQRPETTLDEAEQRKLVAWLVFCARWEDLVDDLIVHASQGDRPRDEDCLEWLEGTMKLGVRRAEVHAFRQRLTAGLDVSFAADDLARDGVLAQAAIRTRLLRWAPADDAAPDALWPGTPI